MSKLQALTLALFFYLAPITALITLDEARTILGSDQTTRWEDLHDEALAILGVDKTTSYGDISDLFHKMMEANDPRNYTTIEEQLKATEARKKTQAALTVCYEAEKAREVKANAVFAESLKALQENYQKTVKANELRKQEEEQKAKEKEEREKQEAIEAQKQIAQEEERKQKEADAKEEWLKKSYLDRAMCSLSKLTENQRFIRVYAPALVITLALACVYYLNQPADTLAQDYEDKDNAN